MGMGRLWPFPKLLFIKESRYWHLLDAGKKRWIMRINLLVVLMTTFLIQVHASGFAQKVTLSENKRTLKEILQNVRNQTGYDFLYDVAVINNAGLVTVSIKNGSLEEALDRILKNQHLKYSISNKVIVIDREEPSFSQRISDLFNSIDINGRLLDEKGSGLAGATVKVRSRNLLLHTDKDGFFVLKNLDPKDIVEISYVGYKSLSLQAGEIKGPVSMELASSKLDEVTITTAYGIERSRKELGYSVAKVSGTEINKSNDGTILNGLTGKVSGLNIVTENSSMSPQMRVLIRGIRSFGETSNNQPLFIFNGAPLSFGSDGESGQNAVDFINNLNPLDIEDVTVLKGANGTALYGPEGVNGVIIITTKKPKSGTMAVNARVNQSYRRIDWRTMPQQNTFGLGNDVSFFGGKTTSSWGPAYDGRMIAIGYPDASGKFQTVPYTPNNDRHEFFNVATTNRTNISLSQSDQNSSTYLGVGHVEQTGLLPMDKQNQTTALYSGTKKFGSSLDILFNINYSKTSSDRGGDVTNDVLTTPSFIPLLSYKDYQNSYWGSYDNYWSGLNPYAKLALSRTKQIDNTFTSSFTVNIKPASWLNIKDQISLNYLGRTRKLNVAPVTFSDFARVDPIKKTDILPQTTDYLGSTLALNNDLLITAIHETGDFMFRANFGGTIRDNYEKQLQTKATLVIPVYNDIYSRTDYGIGADELTQQTRSISAFGSLSTGYKNKVFLELTGRNEWDSKRARAARGKDLYFGANSSVLLKEIIPFFQDLKWLSTFRARLSAVHTANMNIEPNQSERILVVPVFYPYVNAAGQGVPGYILQTNPNPLIKPEKVFSQEYGTEIGVLNNRIRFDASYYHQVNNGVIMRVAVPPLSGYPDYDNAGKFQNTGWEFDLNLSPLVKFSDDINISVQGRFSINNNKVLKVSSIYNGVFVARDPSGRTFYAREGHSAFEFVVLDFMRDPQGRVIVDQQSGLPTVDYQNPISKGKTLPVYQGGATVNVNYKKFTLSTQFDYSAGNDHLFNSNISNGTGYFTLLNNREKFVFPNSVIQDKPGHYIPNTNVPVSNTGSDLFSRFSEASINSLGSASYWKIREVALLYEIPVNKSWVKKVSASIYGRDLFSFYPKSNIYGDPSGSSGPGLPTAAPQGAGQRAAATTNNLTGAQADQNAGPGSVVYGFTLGFTF